MARNSLTGLEQLEVDARTAWASFVYGSYPEKHAAISNSEADTILQMLAHGEHAELILRGDFTDKGLFDREHLQGASGKRYDELFFEFLKLMPDSILVVTLDHIFVIHEKGRTGHYIPRNNLHMNSTEKGVLWHARARDGSHVWCVLPDSYRTERILESGAGEYILKLPMQPGVPEPPDFSNPSVTHNGTLEGSRPQLLTGWRSVEELAYLHLRDLGFGDVQITNVGKDNGLDVLGTAIAAQVKMTALPVGRPTLQQLVGASRKQYLACYSTSGYTKDARIFANEHSISLFSVSNRGLVEPANDFATSLTHEVSDSQESKLWRETYSYCEDVVHRMRPWIRHDWSLATQHNEKAPGKVYSYEKKAREALKIRPDFDTPREMAVHYHHAELLLAVAVNRRGYRYDDPPVSQNQPSPTPTDFY